MENNSSLFSLCSALNKSIFLPLPYCTVTISPLTAKEEISDTWPQWTQQVSGSKYSIFVVFFSSLLIRMLPVVIYCSKAVCYHRLDQTWSQWKGIRRCNQTERRREKPRVPIRDECLDWGRICWYAALLHYYEYYYNLIIIIETSAAVMPMSRISNLSLLVILVLEVIGMKLASSSSSSSSSSSTSLLEIHWEQTILWYSKKTHHTGTSSRSSLRPKLSGYLKNTHIYIYAHSRVYTTLYIHLSVPVCV